MNNHQTARILGYLGQDCILRNSGQSEFLTFTVAVSHKYRDRQGIEQKYTQWFSCTSRQTSLEKYLTKGTRVMVEGPFEPRMYQTKDGRNGIDVNISANTILLLGTSGAAGTATAEHQEPEPQVSAELTPTGEDDLPF